VDILLLHDLLDILDQEELLALNILV